jgi:MFS family permease
MGIPPELVQRSAAARAAADGTSVDDILAAWAGDAPAPSPSTPAEPESQAEETPEEASPPQAEAEPAAAAVAVIEQPEVVAPAPAEVEVEQEQELEPVAITTRIKTAVRIGAWTGAALGVVGFLVATVFWAPNATVEAEGAPLVQVNPTSIIIGIAVVSVVFGAIVAGMSRAATAWTNPAMQLSGSKTTTAWLGALVGVILGMAAGATLNGFGTPVEGSDPAMVQLPVLATLFVMIIGGAVLGAVTALIPQLIGVPVAVDYSDTEEVEAVKKRLGNAMSIPAAGLLLLLVLVLPFAYALIQSNHLAPGIGGAVVAIVAAGGILGFSALAGSKPEMRISFGDVVWALVGIGVILVIVISVLLHTGDGDHEDEPAGEAAAAVLVI